MNPHMVRPRFVEKREDLEFGHLGPGSYLDSLETHTQRQLKYKMATLRSTS